MRIVIESANQKNTISKVEYTLQKMAQAWNPVKFHKMECFISKKDRSRILNSFYFKNESKPTISNSIVLSPLFVSVRNRWLKKIPAGTFTKPKISIMDEEKKK